MVLFIIFCPLVAAILIMVGAPARKTALTASVLTFAAALYLLATFGDGEHGFQHVTSFTISPEWRLSFTTGIDGLSLIMVLLATIVTLAAIWFAGTIERYENAFYACLLFISDWNLGKRKSSLGSLENYNLSRDRQFHFTAWPDPALSKRPVRLAQL